MAEDGVWYSPQQRETTSVSCVTQDYLLPVLKDQGSDTGQDASSRPEVRIKWAGWPGDHVFRLVISVTKVGRLIGRKGEFIQRIRCETKAKIKILDGVAGSPERIVMVSAKEMPDMAVSPAMDAVLRIHRFLIDDCDPRSIGSPLRLEIGSSSPTGSGEPWTTCTYLLVPPEHAGSLIGRRGEMVQGIQHDSGARVRVLPLEAAPLCALSNDRMVEIYGGAQSVHKALHLIVAHLRKFLLDRSVLVLFETNRARAGLNANSSPGQHQITPGPSSGIGATAVTCTNDMGYVTGARAINMENDGFSGYGNNFMPLNQLSSLQTFRGSESHPRDVGLPFNGRRDQVPKFSSSASQPPNITPSHMVHLQTPISHDSTIVNPGATSLSYCHGPTGTNPTTDAFSPWGMLKEPPGLMKHYAPQVPTAQQMDRIFRNAAMPHFEIPTPRLIDQGFLEAAASHIPTANEIQHSFRVDVAGHGAPSPIILGSMDTNGSAYASQNVSRSSAANDGGHPTIAHLWYTSYPPPGPYSGY